MTSTMTGSLAGRRVLVNSDVFPTEAAEVLLGQGIQLRHLPTGASVAEMIAAVAEAPTHAIISRSTPIGAGVMDAAGPLAIVSKFGAGYDNVDLAAAAERGIVVTRAHGANARSVAELAFAMMVMLARSLVLLDRAVRGGAWDRTGVGAEITGKCLGIVGCGAVGTQMAAVSRGYDMRLLVYDPYIDERALPAGAERLHALDPLLQRADIVSLHCPLTEETRGMIGAAALRRMQRGALLINAARGPVVEEGALVAALREGRIAGAGLDTFETEPPSPSSPLWQMPNVVVSPHIGAQTREAVSRVAMLAARNVLTVLEGRRPDTACLVVPAPGAWAAAGREPDAAS